MRERKKEAKVSFTKISNISEKSKRGWGRREKGDMGKWELNLLIFLRLFSISWEQFSFRFKTFCFLNNNKILFYKYCFFLISCFSLIIKRRTLKEIEKGQWLFPAKCVSYQPNENLIVVTLNIHRRERGKWWTKEKKIIKTLSQPKITFFVFYIALKIVCYWERERTIKLRNNFDRVALEEGTGVGLLGINFC